MVAVIHSICCELHMTHQVNLSTFVSLPNLEVLIDSNFSALYQMAINFCVYLTHFHVKNLVRGKNG